MEVRVRALFLCLLAAAPALAQESRPIAITNARILTMAGAPIERGIVVVRDGAVAAVGADVGVPPGALVVDAQGGTLMPGLVSAWSRAGVGRQQSSEPQQERRPRGRGRRFGGGGGRQGGGGENHAARKVIDSIYAREKVFGELLRCGVTTLAVAPDGDGLPGLGAVLDPSGTDRGSLGVRDAAFVLVQPALGTKSKELLRESFAAAREALNARQRAASRASEAPPEKPVSEAKPDAEEKPAERAKEGSEGEKPQAAAGETARRRDGDRSAPDPNVAVLADLLEGKQRAFVTLSSNKDAAHWLDAVGDVRLPQTVLVAASHSSDDGLLDAAIDRIKTIAPNGIVMTPDLTTPAYGNEWLNPAADLHRAGIEIAFVLGDTKAAVREVFFKLVQQVRHGLPADAALRAVTSAPARLLGLENVGSIAVGKDADLLLFSGDPLDPLTRLERIWHKGRDVEKVR
jgi:hypothetical protein